MEFHLVKGVPLDEVAEVFAKFEGEDLDEELDGDPDDANEQDMEDAATKDAETLDAAARPPTPSELKSRLVKLDPPTSIRSRGANQLGRKIFSQWLQPDRDCPMFVVVRSVNRWEDPTATESYALSMALWRDEAHPELHAELEAQLEAVIEVPVEVELEL